MVTRHTFKENVLRVIAVIGLIAVLLLGAWGIIQLAFIIPGFFSGTSAGTPAKETLSLSIPMSVTSGATVNASWTHKNQSGEYGYALSYSCASGVTVKAPTASGTYESVPCNTPFNYTNAQNTMPLVISASKSTAVTFGVAATRLSNGTVTATATANTTVAPAAKAAAPAKSTTTYTSNGSSKYYASGRTTNLYGYPDLAVTITTNPGAVRSGSRIALQFVVQNIGTNVAQAGWNLSATLPYNPVYQYDAGPQQALYPGDKIVYTLGYDAEYSGNQNGYGNCNGWSYPCNQGTPVYGGPGSCNTYGPCNVPGYYGNTIGYSYPTNNYGGPQTAQVQVDTYNQIWEQNEYNNTASVTYTVF